MSMNEWQAKRTFVPALDNLSNANLRYECVTSIQANRSACVDWLWALEIAHRSLLESNF